MEKEQFFESVQNLTQVLYTFFIKKLKAFNLYILIYPVKEQKVSFFNKKSIQNSC